MKELGVDMKQILFTLLLLSVMCATNIAMDAPSAQKDDTSVSTKDYIALMNLYIDEDSDRCSGANKIRYCFALAAKIGNKQVFNNLLEKWEKLPEKGIFVSGKSDSDLIAPLILAAHQGDCYLIEKILKQTNNSIIDWTHEDFHYTALGYAACGGHLVAIRLLLAHNADPHLYDKRYKKCPLQLAIEKGQTLSLKELLSHPHRKASPNVSMREHSQPFSSILHWALSLANRNDCVRELIAHGVFVNYIHSNAKERQLQQQGTPLMIAVDYANKEGVEILLAAKEIDLSIKNPITGKTAREFAESKAQAEWDNHKKEIRQQIAQMLENAVEKVMQKGIE